jgi:cobalt-zinc-cadmium efflux system outer membrane protein
MRKRWRIRIKVRALMIPVVLSGSLLPAEILSLPKALETAERLNPLLGAADAGRDVAQAGILTAKGRPNPETTVIAGKQTGQLPGVPENGVPFYAVTQPLELGPLRQRRIELAQRGRDSSGFAFAEVRLAVLSQVRRTFYEVLRRTREIAIAAENLRAVEDLRNRIRVRVNVGEIGRLELVRAEAEVASARSQASSVELERVTALGQFRAAVGGQLAADIELQGDLDPPPSLPPLEEIRREAIDRHPALAVARSEIRRSEARLEYEKSLRRPQPALRAEVDMTSPSYRMGIVLPLPIFNRREGPIAEAAALVRQTNSEAQARQIDIVAALESAYGRFAVSNQQVQALESGLLVEADEAVRAAQTAYQLGERGILEVLDAQRVLRTVQLNLLNAQFDREAALIDLDELRSIDLRNKP